jgi:hypothetical protein
MPQVRSLAVFEGWVWWDAFWGLVVEVGGVVRGAKMLAVWVRRMVSRSYAALRMTA